MIRSRVQLLLLAPFLRETYIMNNTSQLTPQPKRCFPEFTLTHTSPKDTMPIDEYGHGGIYHYKKSEIKFLAKKISILDCSDIDFQKQKVFEDKDSLETKIFFVNIHKHETDVKNDISKYIMKLSNTYTLIGVLSATYSLFDVNPPLVLNTETNELEDVGGESKYIGIIKINIINLGKNK